MKSIAIIPARGGSKRIPRKNLLLLGGKPLLAYSIEHARQARRVDRTIVSTDDDEIAAVARQYGAEVVKRPPELSTDTATSEDALLHVLGYLEGKEHFTPDIVVFLQCTSPLRKPDDIDNAIGVLLAQKADSLFSCCRSHRFYWRLEDGRPASANYDYRHRPRSQDFKPEYIENGSIYVTKAGTLKRTKNRLGGRIALYEMDPLDSLEIDSREDFLLMEKLLDLRRQQSAIDKLLDIKLVVLDFDGVLTDNRVIVSENGEESVLCHRGDGLGIERLGQIGVPAVVISKEANPVVSARCRKLNIECVQNASDKLSILKRVAKKHKVNLKEVVYVGNDINDIECMKAVGVSVAVADAHPAVLMSADIILQTSGGFGAVRELCDLIVSGGADAEDKRADVNKEHKY